MSSLDRLSAVWVRSPPATAMGKVAWPRALPRPRAMLTGRSTAPATTDTPNQRSWHGQQPINNAPGLVLRPRQSAWSYHSVWVCWIVDKVDPDILFRLRSQGWRISSSRKLGGLGAVAPVLTQSGAGDRRLARN